MSLASRYRAYTQRVLAARPHDLDLYRTALAKVLQSGDRVLHLGCGWDRSAVSAPLRDRVEVVGVDLDITTGSRFHSPFFCADGAKLPFADSMFDVVCSEYVFEHVQEPEALLAELARVLRPGGRVVALTPSRWSYKSLGAAATPHWVHRLAAARLRPDSRAPEDVYATFYRLNSVRQLRALARRTSLTIEDVIFVNNGPTWFRHMPGLFELGRVYHRALDLEALRQLRCGILLTLAKPGQRDSRSKDRLVVRCIDCGRDGMLTDKDSLRCPVCQRLYPRKENVVVALATP